MMFPQFILALPRSVSVIDEDLQHSPVKASVDVVEQARVALDLLPRDGRGGE